MTQHLGKEGVRRPAAEIVTPRTEYDPQGFDAFSATVEQIRDDEDCRQGMKAVTNLFNRPDMGPAEIIARLRFNQKGEATDRAGVQAVIEDWIEGNISAQVRPGEDAGAARREKQDEYKVSLNRLLDAAFALPADHLYRFLRKGIQNLDAAPRFFGQDMKNPDTAVWAERVRKAFGGQEFRNLRAVSDYVRSMNAEIFGVSPEDARALGQEVILSGTDDIIMNIPGVGQLALVPTRYSRYGRRIILYPTNAT